MNFNSLGKICLLCCINLWVGGLSLSELVDILLMKILYYRERGRGSDILYIDAWLLHHVHKV